MTFYLKDTSAGIELYQISVSGLLITLPCSVKLTAYELVRLSQTEGIYLNSDAE